MRRIAAAIGSLLVTACVAVGAEPPADANLLKLEVDALQALRTMELTPAQLKTLASLARGSADGRQREKAKTTPQYATALRNLHAALLTGDEEKIDAADEALDAASESDDVEVDEEVEVTAAAKANGAKALKLLTIKQILAWSPTIGLTDPLDLLCEGFESVRQDEDKADAAKRLIEEVVEHLSPRKAADIRPKLASLLKKVGEMSDADFEGKQTELKAGAAEAIGEVDSFAVLHRGMEKAMAKLVANPRIDAAIAAASKWKTADAE